MSVVGFQDVWITGSRFYFRREPILAVEQEWADFGVVSVINPTFDVPVAELVDSDGGIGRIFDQTVTRITESADIQCSNLSLRNLAFLYLANPPKSFVQAATERTVDHVIQAGFLLKIHDSDVAKTNLFALATIAGIYKGTTNPLVVTLITKATKTIKVTGDQTALAGMAPGKSIIVQKLGLSNILNSRTYKIVTRTLNAGNTDFVVSEEPAADEATFTGAAFFCAGADIIYDQGVDWVPYSIDRGFARIIETGAIVQGDTVKVIFSAAALSGLRLINPQDLAGQQKGDAIIVYGRGGNADQTAREFRCSLLPSQAAFSNENYSNQTLKATVLSQLGDLVPAGRLLHFKGAVPLKS